MSYPSQPSYTPPYGQPQPQPPRQTNLWLVGSAIIAVLIIVMTVTLLIIQRTGDSTEAGGDDPNTTTEEEPTDDGEDPTDEGGDPTDDGGGDTGSSDDGGDTGGEFAGFSEATCEAFDMSEFAALFGEPHLPEETTTSASSSGDTGSLSCSFSTAGYDSSTIYVTSFGDADSAMDWWESDKEFWDEEDDYDVTDFTAFGDAGYHVAFGDSFSQKRGIHVIVGALEIEADVWVYPDEHDIAASDEYLQHLGEQAATMFADYA